MRDVHNEFICTDAIEGGEIVIWEIMGAVLTLGSFKSTDKLCQADRRVCRTTDRTLLFGPL